MISEKDISIVKDILGDDFFEVLEKSEVTGGLVKLGTRTAVPPEEIKIALQIVPRTILSYLFANLKYHQTGDIIDLELPFALGATLHINKRGPDNYSGEITQEGKRLIEFKHRSLPAIGLMILTTFELYDMSLLDEIKKNPDPEKESPQEDSKVERLQDLIDERLTMHRLVHDVVDRRISEREAIDKLIKEKLHSHILMVNSPKKAENPMEDDKKSKLREFLDNCEKRKQEEPLELDKNEIKAQINCPDCDTVLHKSGEKEIKLCICYGQFHNKTIKMEKTQDKKVQLKFPKTFEVDNIEMLLEALRKK